MPVSAAQQDQSDKTSQGQQPQAVTLQLPGSNTTTQVLLFHPPPSDEHTAATSAAAAEAANSLIMYSLQAEEHASTSHQLVMHEAQPAAESAAHQEDAAPLNHHTETSASTAAEALSLMSESLKHEQA